MGKIERSNFFERPVERHCCFGVTHDAQSYLRLLDTFSSHRALDEERRERLLAAVAWLIDEEYRGCVVEGEGCLSRLYVARRR